MASVRECHCTAPSVGAAASKLFGSAEELERWRLWANIAVLVVALFSMCVRGYLLYAAAIAGFVVGFAAFALRLLANRRKALAHRFQRVDMLARAYDIAESCFDVGYLLSELPPSVYRAAVEAGNSPVRSSEYAPLAAKPGNERLRWLIQENAYFNYILYRACGDRALRLISAPIALVLLCMFIALPVIGGEVAYVVLRVIFAVLSFVVLQDQADRCARWQAAARVMYDLENELAQLRTLPDHRVLLLFSNYQVTISASPGILQSIYRQNDEKLNSAWQHRVASLQKSWSNVP